jgi:hypothetical protein
MLVRSEENLFPLTLSFKTASYSLIIL